MSVDPRLVAGLAEGPLIAGASAATHSPARVIQQLLADLGQCSLPSDSDASADWPCYSTSEPDGPDSCVTVYDTTGIQESRTLREGEWSEQFGVQVRIRDANFDRGWKKSREIALALDQQVNRNTVTIDASEYLVYDCHRTSGVMPLGREDPKSKRRIFTVNYLVRLEQTT